MTDELGRYAYYMTGKMSGSTAMNVEQYDIGMVPKGAEEIGMDEFLYWSTQAHRPGFRGHILPGLTQHPEFLPKHGGVDKVKTGWPGDLVKDFWSPSQARQHAIYCAETHGCGKGCFGCINSEPDAGASKYMGVSMNLPASPFANALERRAFEDFLQVRAKEIGSHLSENLWPRINLDVSQPPHLPSKRLSASFL